LFRTAFLVLSGNMVTAVLTLVRNLLIARLIPVADYGIAATFAVVMALIDMITAFGLQQQIIQSKREDVGWTAALQGFQFLRAAISAAVLFMAAGPIAEFLGVPEVSWTYQVLAIALILNGTVHLDIYRMNRRMVYGPMILSSTLPAFVSLLAVWPLYLLFGDYRVMLGAILLQSTLMAAISAVVSERAYRMSLDRGVIRQALSFGWPLMVNNILLFMVMHGEKLVVGRELGMEALAIFAMGFTLTMTPTLVMAKSIQSFFLPQLSAVQEDDARFQPLARATIEANLFNGTLLVVGVLLLGAPFVEWTLGDKYAALVPLLVWMAILQALRVFKAGGAVVSLARARTENAMVANSFRVLSLPLSWWAAIETGDLVLVIWIAIGGEALGVVASLVLARVRAGVRLRALRAAFTWTALLLAAATLFAAYPDLALLAPVPRWSLAALCVALLIVSGWSMRSARDYLRARRLQTFDS
jgi:O-antigen/teichoic acid export membrane protein